jgi:hypothetical protein
MFEGGESAAAQEWRFEIEAECKDNVGARPTQALDRRFVSGSSPGEDFRRRAGARFALN